MENLTSHKQGDRVVIRKIMGNGGFKKRLLEMGFMKNVIIEIVKYAPLHDPMEVMIKSFHMSLRLSEAEHVLVEPFVTPKKGIYQNDGNRSVSP